MNAGFLNLPLRLDKLVKGDSLSRCTLQDSIKQHIHLIITTAFGELPHDADFGCSIWSTDFDNLTSANKIRENVKISIQEAVLKYEPRLEKVKVEILIKEEELVTKINGRQVKKRLDVHLHATDLSTNEPFFYQDHFFTGPLSYY